jgi:hypothetical protein
MLEASAIMEFHFLDYLEHQSPIRFSPFGFFGLGYSMFLGNGQAYQDDPLAGRYNVNTANYPLRVGVKIQTKRQVVPFHGSWNQSHIYR